MFKNIVKNNNFLDAVQKISLKRVEIESFFEKKFQNNQPSIYTSVDIRTSGFKIGVVDTNLFPASFCVVELNEFQKTSKLLKEYITNYTKEVKKILLIAEDQDRNFFYLKNILYLRNFLKDSGFEVRVACLDLDKVKKINDPPLTLYPIEKRGSKIQAENFIPDLIVLNDDLISTPTSILEALDQQEIMPPVQAGWHLRKKSQHFQHYQALINELCEIIQIDSWFFQCFWASCNDNQLHLGKVSDCLKKNSQEMFLGIEEKYKYYDIEEDPLLFLKADQGSYGMGVIPFSKDQKLSETNRKQRKKMTSTKGGQAINDIFIQEGIPSSLTNSQDHATEIVFLYVGEKMVKCFLRSNRLKNGRQNLNSVGMYTENLPFDENNIWLYVHYLISKIAVLAASREIYS